MPVAITHREYLTFLASLPEDSWVDETVIKVGEVEHVNDWPDDFAPEAVLTVKSGYISFKDRDIEPKPLVNAIKAWLKNQSAINVVLELAPAQLEAFNKLAKSNGWKILKGA